MMKMISVSSKKWCDLGRNKGYGWKYGKTRKFICGDKDNPPLCPGTTDHKERFSDTLSAQNSSRGKLGSDNDVGILECSTGIDGAGSRLENRIKKWGADGDYKKVEPR